MLRELQTVLNKNTDAQYKADGDLVTGMGVVKDYATKTVSAPATETVDGVFFVNKERIAKGANTAFTDLSDYFEDFVNIEDGEPVKLITPLTGEAYGTDQFVATGLEEGVGVSVTGGKWGKATIATPFIYTGDYSDAGKALVRIEVRNTAITNA